MADHENAPHPGQIHRRYGPLLHAREKRTELSAGLSGRDTSRAASEAHNRQVSIPALVTPCKRALPERPIYRRSGRDPAVLSGLYGQGDQKDAGWKMFLIKRAGRQRGMNRVEAEIWIEKHPKSPKEKAEYESAMRSR